VSAWLYEDPLSGADEERRPGEHAGGLGKSVLAEEAADGRLRDGVRPLYRKRAMKQKKHGNSAMKCRQGMDCQSIVLKNGSST